jgi:glycosyltransferase involved in cell wall biosynthesis
VENLLSGTPTITSDWGSFTENNLHGITGFRCRTMGDYVDAVKAIEVGAINPYYCYRWGKNFTLDRVAPMYEKYFADVMDVYTGDGWYAKGNDIEAMNRYYP